MTYAIGFPQPTLVGQVRLGRGYTEDASDYWLNNIYDDGVQVAAEVGARSLTPALPRGSSTRNYQVS
jgi:hypothetical protein